MEVAVRLGATKINFVIDTGAAVTVVPPSFVNGTVIHPTPVSLSTASGDVITTQGQALLDLVIPSLRRTYPWNCIVANVTRPLLGYDFLQHHGIVVDCKQKRLLDSSTNIQTELKQSNSPVMAIQIASPSTPAEVQKILQKYSALTSPKKGQNTPPTTFYHRIDTGSAPPVFARPRKMSEEKRTAAKEAFQTLLNEGIIRESSSPWSTPLHSVEKPGGGTRYVGDYRSLNSITTPDRYPIPNINNFTSRLHNTKIYSHLDLVKAFHQIPVHPDDIQKTAITCEFGLFEYLTMPFGLRNASNSFQRYMDHIFRDIPFVFIYIDDILIYSEDEQSHLDHLEQVFKILDSYNLKISLSKCQFMLPQIDFLGYSISKDGIKPTSSKLTNLNSYPYPNSSQSLRRFLGMINFYHDLIPHYSSKVLPLTEYIRLNPNSKHFELSKTERDAFDSIIETFNNLTPLAHPHLDAARYQLVTDSSQYAIGAALHQMIDGESIPIAFFSKKLSQTEQRYSTFDRELLAAYLSVLRFKHLIEGKDVMLLTDHKPLCNAFKSRTPSKSDRQQRHLSFIIEYVTDVSYIRGDKNVVADCLSRLDSEINQITLELCDMPSLAKEQQTDEEMSAYVENLKSFKLNESLIIYCDVATPYPRPYVPLKLRRSIFNNFHNLAHSGTNATTKLIKSRYFWPNLNRDIKNWCRECLSCQSSKIQRHTQSPIQSFSLPSPRFQTVHIDIVGPLPPVQNSHDPYISQNRYVLTMIDRATRWIEASPMADISASTVARTFLETWITRFGVPLHVLTDRGSQFESELFSELSRLTGFHRVRTTSYHPQTNGMCERAHRFLKTALTARKQSWLISLPIVLMAIRSTPNESNYSPFSSVTGSSMLLPKIMISEDNSQSFSQNDIIKLAKEMSLLDIDKLSAGRIHSNNNKSYIPKDLKSCEFVWLRTDRVRKPLEAPYTGPYKVLQRNDKHFVIELLNKSHSTVSIDRLKPCNIQISNPNNVDNAQESMSEQDSPSTTDRIPNNVEITQEPMSEPDSPSATDRISENHSPTPTVTRSGRRIKFSKNNKYHYY